MRGKKRPQSERAQAVGLALVAGVPDAAKATGTPETETVASGPVIQWPPR